MLSITSGKRLLVGLALAAGLAAIVASRTIFSAVPGPNEFPLTNLQAGEFYAVTISVDALDRMTGDCEIESSISDPLGVVATKILSPGDLDFYVTLRPRSNGNGVVRLVRRPPARDISVSVDCRPMRMARRGAVVAALPNSTWQQAQEFELGQTVFGTADDRAFIPAPSEDVYRALVKGFQWFKFTHKGAGSKLVYFTLDVLDREVPVDIEIFQLGRTAATGEQDVAPSRDGQFAYLPEATQNFPGLYKFRTRIVKPGETYFVRVAANHPVWQLRTRLYDPPPYKDPRLAVRAGMDFLINLGDSWHANTPRRGSTALRSAMAHSETQLCIACHPTQFTTRGYLTAVRNGYPVTQRSSLKFLMDRLYNNPRPLYGQEDVNWVRVIYSARTVASRLPLLFDLFEKYVSGEPSRSGIARGYGNYLKIHYRGVSQLPREEPDGCSPSVSPFEIAAQSWQTFDLLRRESDEASWRAERDTLERLTVPAPVHNVIDINWKIAALATIDRSKYKTEIDQLVDQLYGLQNHDGMWGYNLDPKAKASDFITFHSLYALALAGRRPENDYNMAKTLEFCLRTQRPEGSWQGDPLYKGFNTPFRDTQFAVMALSELYPGPGGKGWNAAFPPAPRELHPETVDLFLSEADQFWERPDDKVLEGLRRAAAPNEPPIVRQAALAALGRVADPKAVEGAVAALSAPTKTVQMTAAWALREIASRRGVAHAEIARALASSARARWAAARVFNQHFRELTKDAALRDALIRDLDDPVPHIRYQAAAGLWRWYYWQIDNETSRGRILEALCARMGREESALVRRGLIESIYDLLDENTGYLRAWVKASAEEKDRQRINDGYQAVVRQQSQILARTLQQGNARAREGILTALWDFHTRHMALPENTSFQINLPAVFSQYVPGVPDLHRAGYDYSPYRAAANFKYDLFNGFQQTRIGNDSELIHFFSTSGADLEQALLACLEGADTGMKVNVLKAGHALSEAGSPAFAKAVLRLSLDPDERVRQAVRYVYEKGGRGAISLEAAGSPAPGTGAIKRDLVEVVVSVLKDGRDEGLAVVLPALADLEPDSPWKRESEVAGALRNLVESRTGKPFYADMLRAAASYPELLLVPMVQARVSSGLKDRSSEVRRAALQIMLDRFLEKPELVPLAQQNIAGFDSPLRGLLISELSAPRKPVYKGRAASATGLDGAFLRVEDIKAGKDLLKEDLVLKTVAESLNDRDGNIRAAALDLVTKRKDLHQRPEIVAALNRLRTDPAPRLAKLASALLDGRDPESIFADDENARLLDFDFFVQKVQPILAKRGADGMACVMCHESHAILKLQPPDYNEQFSDRRSRDNYRYALGVVNVAQPANSLILIKPTRPSDSAGDVQDYLATHNGGERWPGNEKSLEYQTILQWIRGARLSASGN